MANKYIEVPVEAMDTLCAKGFTVGKTGRERTYVRPSKSNPGLRIEVLSSITEGAGTARAKDSDAIRVLLVASMGTRSSGEARRSRVFFTAKVLRVNSVDGVLQRTWAAVEEAAQEAQKILKVCPVCGAPAYTDSGRCYVRECREAAKPQETAHHA